MKCGGARMSSAQITALLPRPVLYTARNGIDEARSLKISILAFPRKKAHLNLKKSSSMGSMVMPVLNSSRSSSIVCLSNSNSGANSEGSPWKAFEKALGNITRGQSIDQVLKQQIEKKEFYPDRNGGSGPPSGSGGGGGSGSGGGSGFDGDGADESGGTEDEGLRGILDETLQVFLATSGIILLYIYILDGKDLSKLVTDYLIYVFKGTESPRLKPVLDKWRMFWKCWTEPEEEEEDDKNSDEWDWLLSLIVHTRTMYDSPQKYLRMFGLEEKLYSLSEADKKVYTGKFEGDKGKKLVWATGKWSALAGKKYIKSLMCGVCKKCSSGADEEEWSLSGADKEELNSSGSGAEEELNSSGSGADKEELSSSGADIFGDDRDRIWSGADKDRWSSVLDKEEFYGKKDWAFARAYKTYIPRSIFEVEKEWISSLGADEEESRVSRIMTRADEEESSSSGANRESYTEADGRDDDDDFGVDLD